MNDDANLVFSDQAGSTLGVLTNGVGSSHNRSTLYVCSAVLLIGSVLILVYRVLSDKYPSCISLFYILSWEDKW